MTIDDLCREIAEKTAREGIRWRLTPGRFIRDDKRRCPLMVVFGSGHDGLIRRAVEGGMDEDDVMLLIHSADLARAANSTIRAKLLRATGLA